MRKKKAAKKKFVRRKKTTHRKKSIRRKKPTHSEGLPGDLSAQIHQGIGTATAEAAVWTNDVTERAIARLSSVVALGALRWLRDPHEGLLLTQPGTQRRELIDATTTYKVDGAEART